MRYRKQIIITRNDSTKQNLRIKPGEMCLNIASLGIDDFRTNAKYDEVIIRLWKQKIDIACIQETHNAQMRNNGQNGYTITFRQELPNQEKEPANTNGIGGVAVSYLTTLHPLITKINKVPHRIIDLRTHCNLKCKTIQILNTYPPYGILSN